eukprot:1088255_1
MQRGNIWRFLLPARLLSSLRLSQENDGTFMHCHSINVTNTSNTDYANHISLQCQYLGGNGLLKRCIHQQQVNLLIQQQVNPDDSPWYCVLCANQNEINECGASCTLVFYMVLYKRQYQVNHSKPVQINQSIKATE